MFDLLSEADKKIHIEKTIKAFLDKEQQQFLTSLSEREAFKILRNWIFANKYEAVLEIWVDVTSTNRYTLLPIWHRERWDKYHKNVYQIGLHEKF
jgi:hypothetical protein